MDKEEYNDKMNQLLNDNETYKKERKDRTNTLQNKNNAFVKRLKSLNLINDKEEVRLSKNDSRAPRIKTLPKIHKPNVPMRPIVATYDSPCYNLSKFLDPILKNLIDKDVNITCSYEFQKFITTSEKVDNSILVSFDVINLFTNVPVHTTLDIIETRWEELNCNIPQELFMNMLRFCLYECSYFLYQGDIYNQIKGVAMGNPLAPTIAAIYMDFHIKNTIGKMKDQPRFFKKYVDDCITEIKYDEIDNILETLNSYNSDIQFTYEAQTDKSINFLDMQVINDPENKFYLTDWYYKDTASLRIMNYKSCHPTRYKRNIVGEISNRILSLSDRQFWNKNIKLMKSILRENNYPQNFVNKIINNRIRNFGNPKIIITPPPSESLQSSFRSLTYIKGMSENLEKLFRKQMPEIKVAHKIIKSNKLLFSNMKDKIGIMESSDVVYSVSCKKETCHATYIGQTSRYLKTRLKEHENNIKKVIKNNNEMSLIEPPISTENIQSPRKARIYGVPRSPENKKSAITAHARKCKHGFNLDQTKILQKEKNLRKRLILESIEIIKNTNSCNTRSDIENINDTYMDLITKISHQ
jgi:hypothetical protein